MMTRYHRNVAERISAELLELARRISTATLSAQMQKHGFVRAFMVGVQPLRPDLRPTNDNQEAESEMKRA